ncbi:Ig-like domain repeat protein [Streptomyces sp. NPDC008343]|uniref:Ig-like domain repeat protein n=1 Tax=Streptomyces sp. NPDC008343 TaxID=3364828 RepID=UPI0036EEF19B
MAVSPDSATTYVVNGSPFDVSVIDTATNTVTATIDVPAVPTSVTVATVGQAAESATDLASSQNPSTVGQAVTFTATVSGDAGTPTGTVTFYDDGNVLGTDTLDATGQATFTTSSLTAGTHPITAEYGGDDTYDPSTSNTVNQVVTAAVPATCSTVTPGNPQGFNIITGNNRNNILVGTSGRDAIFGLGGNDILEGRGGNDLLCGGDGSDAADGSAGNDRVEGQNGNDALEGGAGNDALEGGAGNDALDGGTGSNTNNGGPGRDACIRPMSAPGAVQCNP